MKGQNMISGCACCPVNRRNFLVRSGVAAVGTLGWLAAPNLLNAAEPEVKTRIRIIYSLHAEKQTVPDWPNKGFDFGPAINHINTELANRCKDFEFVTSLATGVEQARKIIKADKKAGNIDGYLVYQMNCWNEVVQTAAASGKPVLYADFQFGGSGGFLAYMAEFLRKKTPNVGFVASSKIEDMVEAVKCFRTVKNGGSMSNFVSATTQVRIAATPKAGTPDCKADDLTCLPADECRRRFKESKLLAVCGPEFNPPGEIMGIKVVHVPFKEMNEAWKTADKDESCAVADQWQKNATQVVGVSRETLESSAAMYLGMKALLKKHGAIGITIDCLSGFYGGHIHAYPCLGFHQLNNEALIGGCECDVNSAATMVAGMILTQGRPGYISDPIIDTSKRQIIYTHCVATNKVFGPQGPANPFQILTHSEDRQGASVRSVLPTGYLITTLELEQERKEILFHRAKAVANNPDDRACRTKLCGEPTGDFEKLFTQWDRWGWHRVTFYGDLKEPVYALADALGWKVVEET